MPTNTPQRIGNFTVDRQIGKGGMSEVWLAHHRSLANRQVAIKLLLSQDEEWAERFTREAELTSRLHHPNIVKIYDHGFQPPFHYTVMEYVPGGALRNILEQRKPLPLDLALHIFRGAGDALDYAHSQGVTHRDVSPGNILIEQSTGRVLLTDFGIARESGKPGMTTINKVMGTPGYLSPEHASSATAVTHLSDIYSLGVVLYEMIAGRLPWDHNPGMPDQSGGPFLPPKPLHEVGVQSVPADFERVMQTLLAIDPTKRYPSAQAAVQDIDRVLSRHTSKTQVVSGSGNAVVAAQSIAAPSSAPLAEPHPVEVALGVDLIKGPMQEAEQHAAALTPQVIRRILDEWSSKSRLRRPLLGRQANIHRITHTNVYFYSLRVLYESRTPIKTVEEPDHAAAPVPFEREIDRWSVELPAPAGFEKDEGDTVRLPGSMRVIACPECSGVGKCQCPRCKGQGRVKRTVNSPPVPVPVDEKPAHEAASDDKAITAVAAPAKKAITLVPCPECGGAGGIRCKRCDGVGRLLEKKTTTWRRWPETLENYDDLPNLDEQWLRKNCEMKEVYREQQIKDVRPEWLQVPELKELVDAMQARWDADTRVALSEVSVSFIPITEIVFDLGAEPVAPDPDAEEPDATPQQTLYSWYIYGFENKLPNDWRFLNWDRVLAVIAVGASVILLFYVLLLIVR